MLSWFDYPIIILPVLFVMWMAFYVRRYIRGVADFLSAGRVCGRYLLTVSDVANALSIITLISYVEIHYKTGFALSFWNSSLLPISTFLGLTGYCMYRFRETNAMSIGQFIEMRYSRGLRIFASGLRSISEILANSIMPALAARFFITFLDLPQNFTFCGITFSSYIVVIFLTLILAIGIIFMGGMLSIVVTDALQGLFLYPLVIMFVIFILTKFSWNGQIGAVMMDRAPGESFLNPYDLSKLRDFNFLMFGTTVFATFIHRASWYCSQSATAKNPHEQKMAALLGGWRTQLTSIFYILIAVGIICVLNHKDFAPEAKEIRTQLVQNVVKNVKLDQQTKNQIVDAAKALPEQIQNIGVDKPMGDGHNLDTPYLDSAKEILSQKEGGMSIFQQFRALYYQMMMATTMRNILPAGMLGCFCLLMILAMVSTDDSRIYSAASTLAQDVILPFRKQPFTPKQHIWMIRLVTIGIGIIFVIGSCFLAQMDYIQLFVTIMCSMWLGGCGPVLLFGLYSRFGTTAGAWTSLVTGMVVSLGGIVCQRNWAGHIYPWLDAHKLVEPLGNFLKKISAWAYPVVDWTHIDPSKFPINSYEIYFLTMCLTLVLYCVVSWLTCKKPFNLERMLHRGIYSLGEKKAVKEKWTFSTVLNKLVGITSEYTKMDKFIAWGVFVYSFIYSFVILFLVVIIWNAISPWKMTWWSNYYCTTLLIVPAIISALTILWFGIGGVRDMFRLFHDLRVRKVNHLDDGRVEGNVSLADQAAFEEAEKKKINEK